MKDLIIENVERFKAENSAEVEPQSPNKDGLVEVDYKTILPVEFKAKAVVIPTMKETGELLEWLGDLAAVVALALKDGKVEASELFPLLPVIADYKQPFEGLDQLKPEALAFHGPSVDNLFNRLYEKLIVAEVPDILASTITNNLKAIYTTYCAVVQQKG